MFSDLLKQVEQQLAKKLPFVIYRKPSEPLVRLVLQNNNKLHLIEDFSETGFVFAPFDTQRTGVLLLADKLQEAEYTTNSIEVATPKFEKKKNTAHKEFHLNLVQKGIDKINNSDLKKVVLSHAVEVPCSESPLVLFQKLLDAYETAFCYLWYHPKVGLWIGATPEILLKTESQVLTTMSLAGTQKRKKGQHPEWKKKEIEEQQLVTDYIFDALKNTVANIKIGERESVKAGSLWHLRTKLSGNFAKEEFAAILKALHPTPAVCGMPREEAKQFIVAHENYEREYYTGYLGELNFKTKKERATHRKNQENKAYVAIKKTTTLFVNLRCMQLLNEMAKIYVGGGVTAGSIAEQEWEETVAKCATMLRIMS